MILVDANLLIYAIDTSSPQHPAARRCIEQLFSSRADVGLAWIVILAFLRLTTHPAVMRHPLSTESALSYVDDWLNLPSVTLLAPGSGHWAIFRRLMKMAHPTGNLTSDAHLAALAIEHGCEIYSTDSDFNRFHGITHINPLVTRS
ncbi:MAG: type II toxin-antitoxin system VapC family toxin [Nitrospira sp.]|nr:type II toxin-antitoxin system VapC family toxin [Nitrospira sp.]